MNKPKDEMSKEVLLRLPNKPEFLKSSMRVLEGDGFDDYESALNGATLVVVKDEKADHLYNGIMGHAIEGRIRDVVGATQKDMALALETDFYVINTDTEKFVKCTGRDISLILKEAKKRGVVPDEDLKAQLGFQGVKEITMRPITEYTEIGKFQRYMTNLKNSRDEAGLEAVADLLEVRQFNISNLFEFARQIANARYFNIEPSILASFSKQILETKRKADTGGFF